MFSNKRKNDICFLCMCNKPTDILSHAVAIMSPASGQTLLYVIENIAKTEKQFIKLPTDIRLCIECSRRIIKFDAQWCLLMESINKAINCLYGDVKTEPLDTEVEEEKDEIAVEMSSELVVKEFQVLEPPPTDYDLVQELKRKNANNLFASLGTEKEIQQDVAIKEQELIDDPLTADGLKVDTLEEQELHTFLFEEKPIEVENTEEQELHTLLFEEKPIEVENTEEQMTTVSCKTCFMEFNNQKELNEHIELTHKIQLKFKCDECSFAHVNENHLILHRNTHRGLLETQCPWCEKKLSTKKCAIRHMEQHMEKEKYQCDKCGLGFTQSMLFENHQMIHDGEENPLICEICKKRFKTRKTFRRHAIKHREDRPRYTCEQCGKVFVDKYTHTKHMRLHLNSHAAKTKTATTRTATTTTIQTFNCIICNETFSDKPKLDEHMANNHDVVIQ